MLAFSFLAIFAFLFTPAAAAPNPLTIRDDNTLVVRAGPSGSAISPAGGLQTTNDGTGYLYIVYSRLTANFPGPATVAIDLYLEDMDGSTPPFPPYMVRGLGPDPAAACGGNAPADITAFILPPVGACGTYRLVFIEHQIYEGKLISFRSAAPTIDITCVPFVS